jgi:hypothetical protein
LTIALWVNPDRAANGLTSVLYEQGGYWSGLNLLLDNGVLKAGAWSRSREANDWPGTILHGGRLSAGIWSQLTLVLNSTESTMSLYVNGELVDSGFCGTLAPTADSAGVGQVQEETVYRGRGLRKLNAYQGKIDELGIWDTVLSAEEVETLILSTSL